MAKVSFTDEQQRHLNALLADQRRSLIAASQPALDELRTEIEAESETFQTQLDELKAQAEAETEEETKRWRTAIQHAEADAARLENELVQSRIQEALLADAEAQGFFDPNDVLELAEHIRPNDAGGFNVVNQDGSLRKFPSKLNDGAAYTISDLVADYANQKKHLVRANFRGGAGSTHGNDRATLEAMEKSPKLESLFGPKASYQRTLNFKRAHPQQYEQMKVEARKRGLIA